MVLNCLLKKPKQLMKEASVLNGKRIQGHWSYPLLKYYKSITHFIRAIL